jgi:hypothetical protein
MNDVDMAINFASVVNLIAIVLLIRAVIKDRDVLKGFSVSGTFLTFIAVFGFDVGFFLMGNYLSFALNLVNLAFWLMAFVFSFRNHLRLRSR